MRKFYVFYLPSFHKEITIYAKDESIAVWKLFQMYKLRENEIDNYIIRRGN